MSQIIITQHNEYDYRDDAALVKQGAKRKANCSLSMYVHDWTPGCKYELIITDGRTVTPAILRETGDEMPFADDVKEECYQDYLESNTRNGYGYISRSQYGEIASAAATLGRKGGASRSKAKQAASRENGNKGGRPRINPE
jgi:hypothetical protein